MNDALSTKAMYQPSTALTLVLDTILVLDIVLCLRLILHSLLCQYANTYKFDHLNRSDATFHPPSSMTTSLITYRPDYAIFYQAQ